MNYKKFCLATVSCLISMNTGSFGMMEQQPVYNQPEQGQDQEDRQEKEKIAKADFMWRQDVHLWLSKKWKEAGSKAETWWKEEAYEDTLFDIIEHCIADLMLKKGEFKDDVLFPEVSLKFKNQDRKLRIVELKETDPSQYSEGNVNMLMLYNFVYEYMNYDFAENIDESIALARKAIQQHFGGAINPSTIYRAANDIGKYIKDLALGEYLDNVKKIDVYVKEKDLSGGDLVFYAANSSKWKDTDDGAQLEFSYLGCRLSDELEIEPSESPLACKLQLSDNNDDIVVNAIPFEDKPLKKGYKTLPLVDLNKYPEGIFQNRELGQKIELDDKKWEQLFEDEFPKKYYLDFVDKELGDNPNGNKPNEDNPNGDNGNIEVLCKKYFLQEIIDYNGRVDAQEKAACETELTTTYKDLYGFLTETIGFNKDYIVAGFFEAKTGGTKQEWLDFCKNLKEASEETKIADPNKLAVIFDLYDDHGLEVTNCKGLLENYDDFSKMSESFPYKYKEEDNPNDKEKNPNDEENNPNDEQENPNDEMYSDDFKRDFARYQEKIVDWIAAWKTVKDDIIYGESKDRRSAQFNLIAFALDNNIRADDPVFETYRNHYDKIKKLQDDEDIRLVFNNINYNVLPILKCITEHGLDLEEEDDVTRLKKACKKCDDLYQGELASEEELFVSVIIGNRINEDQYDSFLKNYLGTLTKIKEKGVYSSTKEMMDVFDEMKKQFKDDWKFKLRKAINNWKNNCDKICELNDNYGCGFDDLELLRDAGQISNKMSSDRIERELQILRLAEIFAERGLNNNENVPSGEVNSIEIKLNISQGKANGQDDDKNGRSKRVKLFVEQIRDKVASIENRFMTDDKEINKILGCALSPDMWKKCYDVSDLLDKARFLAEIDLTKPEVQESLKQIGLFKNVKEPGDVQKAKGIQKGKEKVDETQEIYDELKSKNLIYYAKDAEEMNELIAKIKELKNSKQELIKWAKTKNEKKIQDTYNNLENGGLIPFVKNENEKDEVRSAIQDKKFNKEAIKKWIDNRKDQEINDVYVELKAENLISFAKGANEIKKVKDKIAELKFDKKAVMNWVIMENFKSKFKATALTEDYLNQKFKDSGVENLDLNNPNGFDAFYERVLALIIKDFRLMKHVVKDAWDDNAVYVWLKNNNFDFDVTWNKEIKNGFLKEYPEVKQLLDKDVDQYLWEAAGSWKDAYAVYERKTKIIPQIQKDPSYNVMLPIYIETISVYDDIAKDYQFYKDRQDDWKLACNIVNSKLTDFSKNCLNSVENEALLYRVYTLLNRFKTEYSKQHMTSLINVVPAQIIEKLNKNNKAFDNAEVDKKAKLLLDELTDELADKIYDELEKQGIFKQGDEKQMKQDIINKHHCNLESVQQAMEQEKDQERLNKLDEGILKKALSIYENKGEILKVLAQIDEEKDAKQKKEDWQARINYCCSLCDNYNIKEQKDREHIFNGLQEPKSFFDYPQYLTNYPFIKEVRQLIIFANEKDAEFEIMKIFWQFDLQNEDKDQETRTRKKQLFVEACEICAQNKVQFDKLLGNEQIDDVWKYFEDNIASKIDQGQWDPKKFKQLLEDQDEYNPSPEQLEKLIKNFKDKNSFLKEKYSDEEIGRALTENRGNNGRALFWLFNNQQYK